MGCMMKNFKKGFFGLCYLYDCIRESGLYPNIAIEIYKLIDRYSKILSGGTAKKMTQTYSNVMEKEMKHYELSEVEFRYLISDVSAFVLNCFENLNIIKDDELLEDLIVEWNNAVSEEEKEKINTITDDFIRKVEKYAC